MDRYLMLTVAFLAAFYLNTASGMLYSWVNDFTASIVLLYKISADSIRSCAEYTNSQTAIAFE